MAKRLPGDSPGVVWQVDFDFRGFRDDQGAEAEGVGCDGGEQGAGYAGGSHGPSSSHAVGRAARGSGNDQSICLHAPSSGLLPLLAKFCIVCQAQTPKSSSANNGLAPYCKHEPRRGGRSSVWSCQGERGCGEAVDLYSGDMIAVNVAFQVGQAWRGAPIKEALIEDMMRF